MAHGDRFQRLTHPRSWEPIPSSKLVPGSVILAVKNPTKYTSGYKPTETKLTAGTGTQKVGAFFFFADV